MQGVGHLPNVERPETSTSTCLRFLTRALP